MRIEVAGENALIIYFGDKASPETSAKVQQAVSVLEIELADRLIDLVPSYASLLVIYDLFSCDHLEIKKHLRELLTQLDQAEQQVGDLVSLPVYYSPESGPDLEMLAQNANLEVDEVIQIHSQQEYRVYAIGFAPGFAYLGEVDPRIAAPRLSTPRQKVTKGAVAIADRQTAVYPAESPGGWNLIGLCPTEMFTPDKTPNMPVKVGDRVTFKPITRDEYLALGGQL
ncbi:5-oxoprolinase subunit PxpB [Neptuniibacter sp. PT34_22]|uniref:5-oxoprolinase subunit PxpB n=1 Tax=Neptuniibacter sp. PT34_22 TaxID=3398205 RepID=UPI0039F4F9CA